MIEFFIKFILFFETRFKSLRETLVLILEYKANQKYEAFVRKHYPDVKTSIYLWEDKSCGRWEYWTQLWIMLPTDEAFELENEILHNWFADENYDRRARSQSFSKEDISEDINWPVFQ